MLLGFVWCEPSLHAQAKNVRDPAPHLGYAYPAGGRVGTTFRVVVGGQYLDNCNQVSFLGDGITARVVEYRHPISQKEFEALKEKAEAMQAQRKAEGGNKRWSPEELSLAAEIRGKLGYRMNRQLAPAISEAVTLEVTIAPDAPIGTAELRLHTPNGSSNPLKFCVGTLPEYARAAADPNTAPPYGKEGDARSTRVVPTQDVTLPAMVNGQVLAGETHRIRFPATKNLSLVVRVEARSLIPYLADAVPGWFQAAISLTDSKGAELASADDFRFDPDPVLHFVIPEDGEYVLVVKDSLFRGRQDFVYRISLGELPFITGLFPIGGPAGASAQVEVRGWNLPVQKAVVNNPTGTPGVRMLALRGRDGFLSNEVPYAMDDQPEVAEAAPGADGPQRVPVPCIINGRISRPGERDVYAFEGKAGQKLVAEVLARRLNSPVDSALEILDSEGNRVAFNDDFEDKGAGLSTHHADSYILTTLPKDGTYRVLISDTQGQGGPEYAYRLHLRQPHPDYELRVVPSAFSLRPGASTPVTVHVLRKDGFDGEVQLGMRDPSGVLGMTGGRVPPGANKVTLTIVTPQQAVPGPVDLSFFGRAPSLGNGWTRQAIPAEDMMQAFAYRHLVPSRQLLAEVMPREKAQRMVIRLTNDLPLRLPVGGTVKLHLQTAQAKFADSLQVELIDPPEGVSLKEQPEDSDDIEIQVDPAKAKAGLKGNLLLLVSAERPNATTKKKKGGGRYNIGYLPAVPFEVVGGKP